MTESARLDLPRDRAQRRCRAANGDCCAGQSRGADQFRCDGVTCCFYSDVFQNGSCNPG